MPTKTVTVDVEIDEEEIDEAYDEGYDEGREERTVGDNDTLDELLVKLEKLRASNPPTLSAAWSGIMWILLRHVDDHHVRALAERITKEALNRQIESGEAKLTTVPPPSQEATHEDQDVNAIGPEARHPAHRPGGPV